MTVVHVAKLVSSTVINTSLTVLVATVDGGSLRGLSHSQTAAAAPRGPRRREGQHILQATPGTVQTPQKVNDFSCPQIQHITTCTA